MTDTPPASSRARSASSPTPPRRAARPTAIDPSRPARPGRRGRLGGHRRARARRRRAPADRPGRLDGAGPGADRRSPACWPNRCARPSVGDRRPRSPRPLDAPMPARRRPGRRRRPDHASRSATGTVGPPAVAAGRSSPPTRGRTLAGRGRRRRSRSRWPSPSCGRCRTVHVELRTTPPSAASGAADRHGAEATSRVPAVARHPERSGVRRPPSTTTSARPTARPTAPVTGATSARPTTPQAADRARAGAVPPDSTGLDQRRDPDGHARRVADRPPCRDRPSSTTATPPTGPATPTSARCAYTATATYQSVPVEVAVYDVADLDRGRPLD